MKAYKAFLKDKFFDRNPKLNVTSPILISETELDLLLEGETVYKVDESGNTFEIEYSDMRMIVTFD